MSHTLRVPVNIVITAGGTKEPIDDVRCITNLSSGGLGRALAVAAHERGHRVLLLAPAELPKLAGELPAEVEHRPYRSTADLERELRRAAGERTWDVVLHAAAVSDYRPVPIQGKIASDQDELVLRLVRTPKLIAHLREWFGRSCLVGFKLTSGVAPAERVRIALEQIARNRTDACVENDIREFGPGEHKARIVKADGTFVEIPKGSKAAVARAIVEQVERLALRQ